MSWWPSSSCWSPLGYCCEGGANGHLEGRAHEHSESDAGCGSIPDIARSNPADGVAIAAFQASLRDLPEVLQLQGGYLVG
jgi:hypothetical protein